jgi:hypothetical protein
VHPYARVDVSNVGGWTELDRRWAAALGFPSWYGHNRDAWLDIMSSLDEIGMTSRPFEGKGPIVIEVHGAEGLPPEVLHELIALTSAANVRYQHSLSGRELALVFTEPRRE